jgi:hypothetical protein
MVHHENREHVLQDFVLKFGSEEKAFIAVEKVANNALKAGKHVPNTMDILPSVEKVLNVDGIKFRSFVQKL